MEYNIDKCRSTTFEEKLASSDPLFLNGNIVPTVDSIEDLGITISNNFTRDNHNKKKLVAARKAYHFLKRSIPHSVSSSTKLMYYRLCVQSIILYGSQIWYPSINYRRKLEIFNKECLFWVTGLQNYSQQLAASNTLPLSFYLVLNDMVFLNKAINNKYDLNLSTFILSANDARISEVPNTNNSCQSKDVANSPRETPSSKESVTTPTSSPQKRLTFLTQLKNLNMNSWHTYAIKSHCSI